MSSLVVFFIPPEKRVSGGILSIFSLCKESRRFASIHKSEVLISVTPGSKAYKHNDLFENEEEIFSFDQVVKDHPKLSSLILHIPEYLVPEVSRRLAAYEAYLSSIPYVQINVLNQNIDLMPPPLDVLGLFRFTDHVTQTTAHISYTTQATCNKYGVPTHLLSVWIDPSQYQKTKYESKQNIIAVSPDSQPLKPKIISRLKQELPDYTVIEIMDLSYEDYKSLIAKAKFVITFGEGFDGYFIETAFSNGIAFAVYNERFFPSNEYQQLRNVYSTYEEMLTNVAHDITALGTDAESYGKLNDKNYDKLSALYSYDNYLKNIESFYKKTYSLVPNDQTAIRTLISKIAADTATIDARESRLAEQHAAINELLAKAEEQGRTLHELLNSSSWKLTAPLRGANKKLHKKRRSGE